MRASSAAKCLVLVASVLSGCLAAARPASAQFGPVDSRLVSPGSVGTPAYSSRQSVDPARSSITAHRPWDPAARRPSFVRRPAARVVAPDPRARVERQIAGWQREDAASKRRRDQMIYGGTMVYGRQAHLDDRASDLHLGAMAQDSAAYWSWLREPDAATSSAAAAECFINSADFHRDAALFPDK